MNLPIRARLTALYFVVLALSFMAFFWVSDVGFRRSIEATADNASRTNLEIIQRLLASNSLSGETKVRKELSELAGLWANGALFEVAGENGNWIYRSPQFLQMHAPLPQVSARVVSFVTTNLDSSQYRIALLRVSVIRVAAPATDLRYSQDFARLIATLTVGSCLWRFPPAEGGARPE
jgi:hypothetical protein